MRATILLATLSATLGAGLPGTQEALVLAFPDARFERREHFLSEGQAGQVRALARVDPGGRYWVAYEARRDGQRVGVAFFDTHRVRTQNETVMVAVNADGSLRRVEVVGFREPLEYLPKQAWIRQLEGHHLEEDLSLKRAIRPLSGATLTAQALVDAARRGLALTAVLYGPSR